MRPDEASGGLRDLRGFVDAVLLGDMYSSVRTSADPFRDALKDTLIGAELGEEVGRRLLADLTEAAPSVLDMAQAASDLFGEMLIEQMLLPLGLVLLLAKQLGAAHGVSTGQVLSDALDGYRRAES